MVDFIITYTLVFFKPKLQKNIGTMSEARELRDYKRVFCLCDAIIEKRYKKYHQSKYQQNAHLADTKECRIDQKLRHPCEYRV